MDAQHHAIGARIELQLGHHVATLVDGARAAGEHSVTWTASGQPSGVYFAVMRTDDRMQVKRMTLVK